MEMRVGSRVLSVDTLDFLEVLYRSEHELDIASQDEDDYDADERYQLQCQLNKVRKIIEFIEEAW